MAEYILEIPPKPLGYLFLMDLISCEIEFQHIYNFLGAQDIYNTPLTLLSPFLIITLSRSNHKHVVIPFLLLSSPLSP